MDNYIYYPILVMAEVAYETLVELESSGQLDQYLKLMETNTLQKQAEQKTKELLDIYKSVQETNHLRELAEEEIGPMFYSRSSLYLELKVADKPISALLDTGAETNIISASTVKRLGLDKLIDKSYGGIVKGVGTSKSLGCISYLELKINDIVAPACFTVIDSGIKDMILGLPFMQFYNLNLNFADRTVNLGGKKVPMIIKDH
jgi:hypothetical protein